MMVPNNKFVRSLWHRKKAAANVNPKKIYGFNGKHFRIKKRRQTMYKVSNLQVSTTEHNEHMPCSPIYTKKIVFGSACVAHDKQTNPFEC